MFTAEQQRQNAYEEQNRRRRACSSRLGAAVPCTPPENWSLYDRESWRVYGKRQQIIQGEPETAVAAPCTPPEQLRSRDAVSTASVLDDLDYLFGEEGTQTASSHAASSFRSNAVSTASLLDDSDDLFGEIWTQAASSASGEDELRKAVDEQFKQAETAL